MNSICGADCEKCNFKDKCNGCEKTCGKPFGKKCFVAKYIKDKGKKSYLEFKQSIIQKINDVLNQINLPIIQTIYEIKGADINLEYFLPNGKKIKFLDDFDIYFASQICEEKTNECYGIVSDTKFILISRYHKDYTNPQIILYKQI